VEGAGSRQRLAEPRVRRGELLFRNELGVELVTAADELPERDLIAGEPAACRLEADQPRRKPRIVGVGDQTRCVVGNLGVRGSSLGVDLRAKLGRAGVAVDQSGL